MWHATSAPRDRSYTVNNCHVAKAMPLQRFCGPGTFFKQFFFARTFFNFFSQGRKSYLLYIINGWKRIGVSWECKLSCDV